MTNPRFTLQDPTSSRRGMAGSATERFRPAPLNTAAARGMDGAGNYSGYYQDPTPGFAGPGISQNAMTYQQADYAQDARQPHNFGTYNPNMMYPVGQTGPQNPYEAAQQFQGRQSAPMPMMAGDVPQYFQSDAAAAAASAIPGPQSAAATPSSAIYPQQQQIPGFSGTLPSLGGGSGAGQAGAKGVAVDEPDYSSTGPGAEERWADYQNRLAAVFQDIQSGSLKRASEALLEVSNWLLTQVVDFGRFATLLESICIYVSLRILISRLIVAVGLHIDDRNLHADRLQIWNDFNHGWLGLLQKQKDMVESGQKLQSGQSLISKDELEDLGKEVVKLCDGVEKHGLVDYQYGVWEEEIISSKSIQMGRQWYRC